MPWNRTSSAPIPPAGLTTATTWIGGRSAVGARAVPGEHAADHVRLLARLAGVGLETGSALLGSRVAHPFGEPLRKLRALAQRPKRSPERSLDGLTLGVDRSFRGIG